jgi:excisionase family DNA binding protein
MDYPTIEGRFGRQARVFLMFGAGSAVALFLHKRAVVTENNGHRERSVLIPEAAGVLGVSRRTVYYRIREGRLQTIRTRGGSQRVLWSSIEALLRSMRPALSKPNAEADSNQLDR